MPLYCLKPLASKSFISQFLTQVLISLGCLDHCSSSCEPTISMPRAKEKSSSGLSIDISEPRKFYTPGSTISGNVTLNTTQDFAIGSVTIEFYGRVKGKAMPIPCIRYQTDINKYTSCIVTVRERANGEVEHHCSLSNSCSTKAIILTSRSHSHGPLLSKSQQTLMWQWYDNRSTNGRSEIISSLQMTTFQATRCHQHLGCANGGLAIDGIFSLNM